MSTNVEDALYETFKGLVDAWHNAASRLEGYDAVAESGDSIGLLLLLNRMKNGDIRLSAISLRDVIGSITLDDLYRGQSPNIPSIPSASIIFEKPG